MAAISPTTDCANTELRSFTAACRNPAIRHAPPTSISATRKIVREVRGQRSEVRKFRH